MLAGSVNAATTSTADVDDALGDSVGMQLPCVARLEVTERIPGAAKKLRPIAIRTILPVGSTAGRYTLALVVPRPHE